MSLPKDTSVAARSRAVTRLRGAAVSLLVLAGCTPPTPEPPATADDVVPRDTLTARLADIRAIHTPEGIEVLEPLEVNGTTQWISIRGLNRANPILLVLHGGPGSPVMDMSWAYQKPWEDFFTVVNWDRRGVGKSFAYLEPALEPPPKGTSKPSPGEAR